MGDGILDEPLRERGRQLLRILGEAITNARRHSGAHNIRVGVWTTAEEKVHAEAEDDGRGIDAAKEAAQTASARGGMGIKSMREPSRALGADLEIESEPGEGTKVRFELALKKDWEEPEEQEGEVRILLVEDHATTPHARSEAYGRGTHRPGAPRRLQRGLHPGA
jgi:signal transduction histidine kinase